MIKHTFLLIYRNFRRFQSTFFINLVGLSSGLACTLLIYMWIADELSVDKFHKEGDQLFQVMTNQNRPDDIVTLGYGPGLLAEELAAEMPEVEYAVGCSGVGEDFGLSVPGKKITAAGQFAGQHFFTVFTYPLVYGRADQVLMDKGAVVLSERLARTLFGEAGRAVGRTLEWQVRGFTQEVLVTGVFKDVPVNSSVRFDFVLSFERYKELIGNGLAWGNHNAITYLRLKKNTDVTAFNAKIEHFIGTRDADTNLTIFVRPYADNYLYGTYENGKVVGGRISYVKLFSAIALFILLIACINFMNLSTAKASRRVKEIGIKKAIGAGRGMLIVQYMAESLIMAFVSMLLAVLIVDLFLPRFNIITGKQLSLLADKNMLVAAFAISMFTGLVAGSYPALYLSRFNPANVLKGRLNVHLGELLARRGLVIFQFMVSIILIVSVWVIFRQVEYVQTTNLGYDKDHVIYFKLDGSIPARLETFVAELNNLPGVAAASSMWGSVAGETSFTTGSFDWKGRDPEKIIQFEHLGIHFDMIELLGLAMADGRTFSRDFPADTAAIIVNETAVSVMGLEDPVGERFNLWGRDYTIIGVVKDFHFQSLHNGIKPLFLRLTPGEYDKVLVKLQAGKEKQAIAGVADVYKTFNPGYGFEYEFLDQRYQAQYRAEQRVAALSKYFAGLAILISCLGLFGLASFMAEKRLKEVGIRKVLGSSVAGIVYLLSSDFNKLVAVAIMLALPIAYFGITMWLDTFAYRIRLHWWYFGAAGLIAFAIAWLTVSIQAWKAAIINPVKCLRDE